MQVEERGPHTLANLIALIRGQIVGVHFASVAAGEVNTQQVN
jgi:hypothetical protein